MTAGGKRISTIRKEYLKNLHNKSECKCFPRLHEPWDSWVNDETKPEEDIWKIYSVKNVYRMFITRMKGELKEMEE